MSTSASVSSGASVGGMLPGIGAAGGGSLTAADLLGMLRAHYLPDEDRPGGMFAPEIAAPGHSQRRADLIWQGLTSRSGLELVGHEIKTSRADLAAELADTGKADPWQRYCDRWWLVLPDASLAEGLALPPTWGVLCPPSGRRRRSMTVHIPAPALTPDEQAPALRTLAARAHWRAHQASTDRQAAQQATARLQHHIDELNTQLEAQRGRPDSAQAKVVTQVVDELRQAGVVHNAGGGGIGVEDIITALTDLDTTRQQARQARRRAHGARRQLARIHHATRDALDALDHTEQEEPV